MKHLSYLEADQLLSKYLEKQAKKNKSSISHGTGSDKVTLTNEDATISGTMSVWLASLLSGQMTVAEITNLITAVTCPNMVPIVRKRHIMKSLDKKETCVCVSGEKFDLGPSSCSISGNELSMVYNAYSVDSSFDDTVEINNCMFCGRSLSAPQNTDEQKCAGQRKSR